MFLALVIVQNTPAALWPHDCLGVTGARQASRVRLRYMHQVLRADVSFFDQHATTGELLQGLNADCVSIQDAIGEKVGNFIHHMTTFLVGYAIGASAAGRPEVHCFGNAAICKKTSHYALCEDMLAFNRNSIGLHHSLSRAHSLTSFLCFAAFWRGWDMTLVLLACVPLLAGIGILFTVIFTKTQAKGEAAYSVAASVCQEALSSVRTVFAFCAEPRMLARYSEVGVCHPHGSGDLLKPAQFLQMWKATQGLPT